MEEILIIPIALSFLVVLFFTPIWIRKAKNVGLSGKDMHKSDKREVAEAGGVVVVASFILGILSYIAIKIFVLKTNTTTVEIFALISSILIITFIGLIDDIFGWKIGLNKKIRIFILIFAAIPLMVINAGESSMMNIELGLLYPLIFIPLGIVGAAATFNFLAGYNGLETSQGILILSALAWITWLTKNSWLTLICFIMIASLLIFYIFNKYPAKVLPGDTLTYAVGALIAIVAILGNTEKIAIFFFTPYIIEVILKLRGRLKKESFASLNTDGSLELPYPKIYSLTHLSILVLKKFRKKVYEEDVVYLINIFQISIILIGFLLFHWGIL